MLGVAVCGLDLAHVLGAGDTDMILIGVGYQAILVGNWSVSFYTWKIDLKVRSIPRKEEDCVVDSGDCTVTVGCISRSVLN